MTRTILAACTALAAITLPAAAQDDFKFSFEYSKSQVASYAGAEAIYNELERDARDACRVSSGRTTLVERNLQRECAADLVDQVIAKANRPALTAVHSGVSASQFAARNNDTVIR